MKRAIIYVRVSTQDQADSRLGLESQLSICREFVEKNGYTQIDDPISDAGVSASVPLLSRPFGRCLGGPSVGEITVIALCQDRLFRSVADMLAAYEILAEDDVHIVTVDEGPLDLDDDDRWLSAIMRAVFAELERRRARKRTARGLAALKARGGKVGEPPYGWRKTDVRATFEHDPKEQIVIATILEMDGGDRSAREIARRLNEGQIKTRDGKDWTHTQILRILGRENETGE